MTDSLIPLLFLKPLRQLKLHLFCWHWLWRKRFWSWSKRLLDIMLAGGALLALIPLMGVVAFLIWQHDRGSVFYFQTRIGKRGVPFRFPKFRSMCINSNEVRKDIEKSNQHGHNAVTFKMRHDPRITPVGRWIRRLSIDELPQLWCVLTGKMTVVGPRPPLPSEVARYSLADRVRLEVTPGLTCIWQVSGRANIPFDQQVQMDADYIRERSLWEGLKLICKTIPAVLTGRGAY
jgi:lipopolysaccharide/colanic/teichoic acid biosynthesis glycosyltransferase